MKHTMNTMKRVLAATLSVLTVASPIGANVGVFLTEGAALVASAETYTNNTDVGVGNLAVNDVLENGATITNYGVGNFTNSRAYIYLNGTYTNRHLRSNPSNYNQSYYDVSVNNGDAVRVTSKTGTYISYGTDYGRLDLITCHKLTSNNTTITLNDATNNTVDYDGTAKNFTVRYNNTTLTSTNFDVTIKRNGVEVSEIREAGNYTVTVTGKASYYGEVTSQTFTVYSQDQRYHEFNYADIIPNEVNQVVTFNITQNGSHNLKIDDYVVDFDGTDSQGNMQFAPNKPVTITAAPGKLISSIEFIGTPDTSKNKLSDYTITGASDQVGVRVVTKQNDYDALVIQNVISDEISIEPKTTGDFKFKTVKVYYVDPITVTNTNLDAVDLFYSPDVTNYPLNVTFSGTAVANRGLEFGTDYTVTVEDSNGEAVALTAAAANDVAQNVNKADNYNVTVTGKGVFKDTVVIPWTVAKYVLDFNNAITNANYNARVTEEQANRTYAVKAKEGVENPETKEDYEIATQKYDTSVQVKTRNTTTGALNNNTWFTIEKGSDKDFVISGADAETADINAVTTGALSEAVNANQNNTNRYTATITGVNNFTNSTPRPWTIAKATIANSDYTAPVTSVTDTNPLYYTGTEDTEKKALAVAGTFAPSVQVPTNEDGTAIQGIDAPKFQYKLSTDTNWSDSIPTEKGNAGVDTTYTVQYRIDGGTNYNDISATQQNPMSFNVAIVRKPSTITLTGLDSEANPAILVKTKENGNDIAENMQKAETVNGDGAFDVKAGDEYKLYTDLTVAEDSIVNKSYITAQTFNKVEYGYCYTIKVPAVPSDDGYTLSHSYATTVISAFDNSDVRDKAYVVDNGQVKPVTAIVAEFKSNTGVDGLGKQYYYGNAPTINDVLTYDKLGATVEKEDFYFYLASDTEQKTRLNANQLEAGNTYIVRADVPVTLSNGNKTQAYIEKEIEYVARPLAECQVYLADEDGNETELAVDNNNSVNISKNTFTYNKNEQKPNIVIKSPAYDANNLPIIVTLEDTDLTDNIEAKKNANAPGQGQYTGTLTGESPNFTGDLTVNWSIAQAKNNMTIVPKDGVVYDGELLDITDFTVSDPDNILTEENPVIIVNPNDQNDPTKNLINAGTGLRGSVTITCQNYEHESFDVQDITINKRAMKATPSIDQKTEYGVKAGNIQYELEDTNGVRGLVAADKNDAEIRDKAVLIGNYDYDDVMKNGADKYTYVGNDKLMNYAVEIVGVNSNKFTVTKKDISDFTVTLKPMTGNFVGFDGTVPYYNYDGVTNFSVDVDEVYYGDPREYTLAVTDYKVKGTTTRITANSTEEPYFFVEVEGTGNYEGIAQAPWEVKAQSVKGLGLTINDNVLANDAAYSIPYNGEAIKVGYDYTGTDNSFKENITGVTYSYYEGTTELKGAPKDVGTYTVKAIVTATGYQDSELTCTVDITPATLTNTDKDKEIEYGIDPDLNYDEYGMGYPLLTVDEIDKITGFTDADAALMKQAIEDGKLMFYWWKVGTRQYNGTIIWNLEDGDNTVEYLGEELYAVLNKNYDWKKFEDYTLDVIPKSVARSDIEVIYDASSILGDNVDEDGYTFNKVKVIDKTTGRTLVEGVDYVVNNSKTKKPGKQRIEVVGMENYTSYVRKDWMVTEGVEGVYTFKQQEPGVAINPQNKGIYVKLGFEGELKYSNYRATEYGVIYNNDGTATLDELRLDNPELNEDTKKVSRINVLRNKNGINVRDKGKGVTATGYVILEDKNNPENVHVAYTDFNIGGDTYVCNEYAPQGVTNAGNEYVKVMYEGNIYKKGYSLVEYGLIYNNTGEATVEELTLDNVDNKKIVQIKDKNASNIRDTGKGVTAVGYMIVKNEANLQAVIYTNDLGGKFAQLANLH